MTEGQSRRGHMDQGARGFVNSAFSGESFQEDFIKFLLKAFGTTAPTNVKESRTDVLIEHGILNARPAGQAILDLCCGWPLLLTDLINQLREDKRPDGSDYVYVACDNAWREEVRLAFNRLAAQASDLAIHIHRLTADVTDVQNLLRSVSGKHAGRFNLIVFSNAMHEVDPLCLPALLVGLVGLLTDDGQLVVIDPEATWLLHPDRWKNLERLKLLQVDWEPTAVWLPKETHAGILGDFGCDVKTYPAKRTQGFYVLQAHRSRFDPAKGAQLEKVAEEQLRRELDAQLAHEVDRYQECRAELHTVLEDRHNTKRLLHKAVEFFCLCASQARRVEVRSALSRGVAKVEAR